MTRNVTRQELVEEIKKVITCSAVSIDVETEVKMNKTGNPYFGATKRNTVAGLIGFDYENSVNNQLGREEKALDFIQQQHKWARPTDSRNLLTNQDETKLYLRLKVQSAGEPTFYFKGDIINKALLTPFMPEHRKPHTQDNLDKEVVVRTYGITNIISMKLLGDELIVAEHIIDAEVIRERETREVETV